MAKHDYLVPIRRLTEIVQLSKATIYRRMKDGSFPRPLQISAQRVVWLGSEIDDWISARVEERDSLFPEFREYGDE